MDRGLTFARSPLLFDAAAGFVGATLTVALAVYVRIYTNPGWDLLLRDVVLLQLLPAVVLGVGARLVQGWPRIRQTYWTLVALMAGLAVLRVAQERTQIGLPALRCEACEPDLMALAARLAVYGLLAGVALYVLLRWRRTIVRWFAQLWPAALLVTAAMPLQFALGPVPPPLIRTAAVRDDSVFIFVWDELGRDGLLKDGHIDGERFPNLKALADDGVWFSNGTTNYGYTCNAIPSLLTGRFLEPYACARSTLGELAAGDDVSETGREPFVIANTPNLMVDLASRYDVTVYEEYVFDCLGLRPEFECRGTAYMAAAYPQLALTEIAVPRSVRLAGLGEAVGLTASPYTTAAFQDFLGSVTAAHGRGRAYFVHVLLPHAPYVLDERGRPHGSRDTSFTGDPQADARVHQNYLRQMGYVDRLFGEFVTRLRAEGLYGRSTIIVTTDTGPRPDPAAGDEISPLQPNVPLIVRSPGLSPGVSDVEYQHIDFRSTMLDVLHLPQVPTDGFSAFASERPSRERTYRRQDEPRPYRLDPASGRWLREAD